jgi:acetyl-CoA carboxylase biotin carboxyl carrier protein
MEQRDIKELMKLFDKSDITKIKIKNGDFSIQMQKGSGEIVSVAAASTLAKDTATPKETAVAKETEAEEKELLEKIKSPMVGTFYKAPSPGAAPFVSVGSTVKKGQSIAIVEAMKIMNEIEAEFDCKIVKVLVDDGQPVEFDMPLFLVERI